MKSYEWNVQKVGIAENTPRVCRGCKKTLPVSMFPVNGAGYYEGECKGCQSARNKQRYAARKERGSVEYWYKRWYAIKQNAERRGIGFSLTIQDLKDCYARQRGCCWYTGEPMKVDSVDRVDGDRGYFPDNIIMAERRLNQFRGDMRRDHFVELCKKIAAHHTK